MSSLRLLLPVLTALASSGPRSAWAELPRTLPKAQIESEDASLRFAFMGQLRFTFEDDDVSAGPAGKEKLTLQRIRPILKGSFLDGKLGFKLHLNTGPTTLELLDFFVDYRFSKQLRLRIGQQKVPLTRYRINSFARLTMVDWSTTARAFGAERQIGLAADGALGGGLSYALGVFTGANARSAFEKGLAAAYGERLENPSRLDDPAAPARVHPEVVLRVGWQRGEDPWISASDDAGGPLRLMAGLSAAYDVRPVVARDFAMRLAPEIFMKAHGFSAGLVGYLGMFEAYAGGGVKLGALGLTAQAAFRFFERWEVSLRYSRTQILDALRSDALARAAVDPELPAPPDVAHRQDVGLGFNVYLIGHHLKSQSDVTLRYDGPGGEPGLLVRTQLQLMF